jgi:flagellar motor switch protein FliN/FliY
METIREIPVGVSVELGRTTMPLARAVALPPGTVLELDCGAEDPVHLYVNGRHFASGVLVVVDDEWALRIEKVHGSTPRTVGPS